ncbi:DUF537-domain-containing protein [Mycena metata]|uniref:DUF537-domain-containing protein n=1 Tax=Mycena metata TaxID=1033252 RepID=A0AAD7IWK8_9AGAR|nr:DUF537-domain-containing protein [Mycena metata]
MLVALHCVVPYTRRALRIGHGGGGRQRTQIANSRIIVTETSDFGKLELGQQGKNWSPQHGKHVLGQHRKCYEIVSAIRDVAHRYGPVKHFKAYMEVPETDTSRSLGLRSELQSSGVSLTDCPHNGRKNVADHMIMVDMLAYAMDHPTPATIFLISGDRDFAYAVSVLRLRRFEVVVLSLTAHISLKSLASAWLSWNTHVLAYCTSGTAESPTATRGPPTGGQIPSPPRRASYFGDRESPFSTPKFAAKPTLEPKTAAPSTPAPLERPSGTSFPREQSEGVAMPPPAPAYSANVSQGDATGPSLAHGVEELGRVPVGLFSKQRMTAEIPQTAENAVSEPPLASPILLDSPVRNLGAETPPQNPQTRPGPVPVPVEKEASAKKVPAFFQPLIDVLKKHKSNGVIRPLRSAVGYELVGLANSVYKQAGVKSFKEFTALAEKEGIIRMGGQDGKAWISLHPDWASL